ncbi:MAG: hypothetical protein JSV50_08990 [Desulfobacteraceae bacterium]|nr:MAG: hypothetical protein JSV50_08990 [Desulfobacteraceae bacterium]
MVIRYSVEVHRELEEKFREAALNRPMHVELLEAGTELEYDVIGVSDGNKGKVCLTIEKFIGGGFAGQVYRVKILEIEHVAGPIGGLERGGIFAMKIMIPPTGFSRLFRNALYWVAFQGPFQLQVNPAAARSGAIWQKFIRRGAKIRFGDERLVADIHATFVDSNLGSCGELSEWIEGRTWRLEVDERLDLLKRWKKGKEVDVEGLGSPEYRAKHEFMGKFVELLHDMGAHEFARQYEWSTWKSQPNCLKRKDTEGFPSEGLVAVDFRAGLALLPFLPMSPGDFKLIAQGFIRGSLVQFDRGDMRKLEQFIAAHSNEFADMGQILEELKAAERVYRDSVPDITHNHVRLLYRSRVWSTILDSAVTGWKVRNLLDKRAQEKLRGSKALTLLFAVIGMIPLIGSFFIRIWGQQYWRKHYLKMVTSLKYLQRAVRAKIVEKTIGWHRSGRVDGENALKITRQIWRCLYHFPLSVLPKGLHRSVTDWKYAKERLDYLVFRPVRLYFDAELREQWLREMVTEGSKNHLLNNEDAAVILSQVKEPFVQKYLKSLAVHLCTLPVTQVVSLLVAIIYVVMHPDMPRGQAYGIGLGIIALFQVVPISPGSLVRGLYVVYLVIRERNFKDYNIAVFLGFFKYIGYLAFPIQMAYRYPALARFMAGHWATEAVHIVPVFGERGALLEHGVFCLFYNWPLTIRRKMRKRVQMRATMLPRYWHIVLCAITGSGIFVLADFFYLNKMGGLPSLRDIWGLVVLVPVLCGAAVTLGARGTIMWKRVVGAAVCGGAVGVLYTVGSGIMGYGGSIEISEMATSCVWRVFIFTILSTVGMLLTEIKLPEPEK